MKEMKAFICTTAVALPALTAGAQWAVFEEDPSRLVAPAALGAADPDEKDYAWGDVDRDGDIDLVVVRKQPWTTTGRRPNVLFMNENGVLTDRTAQFASASDVAGDMGFLTPTNDRDVVLVDVDGDQWLDIVTAVTLTDNDAKHLSHPRVYMNLGEIDGVWQGFRYEDARIPQMHATAGPRFCAVSAGDVTGDGAPDLFFSDYDDGPTPQIFDFNDRLLINDGNGFFSDQTTLRLATTEMFTSNFGISNNIVDMNGDGLNDIVRLTANGPYHVGIAYNNPLNQGFFTQYDQVYTLAAYHSAVGDLDGDGTMDIIAIDDGVDRYLLNQGNGPQGMADFATFTFPGQTGIIHAGNVVIVDLDQDGANDVIIADVDVTLPGCNDRTFIMHNLGTGAAGTFEEQGEVIPFDRLNGVHDVAVFDLDGNGWLDLVLGRCGGTDIWMGQPLLAMSFSYPEGRPEFVDAGTVTPMQVQIEPTGGTIEPGSPTFHLSTNGGPVIATPLTGIGPDLYEAVFPAGTCADRFDFFVTAQLSGGLTFSDPETAPLSFYTAVASAGMTVLVADSIEGDISGWTIENDPALTGGAWEQAEPNATVFGNQIAAPGADATPDPDGTMAFVTENGPPGSQAASFDVDGGPTFLVSPVIDLAGSESVVSYARWAFTATGVTDSLIVEVSDDGGDTWVFVESVKNTNGTWETATFLVGDYVALTSQMQVRFGVCDCPNDSVTEAGIDDFVVTAICAAPECAADLDGDDTVGITDFLALLAAWGPNPGHPADLDGDGSVGITDFLQLLANWGPCL